MKSNLLLRHDLVVLKNKSASDAAQGPATGAVVSVYVAGPRAHETTVLRGQDMDPPPPTVQAILVDDPRQTASGDMLQVGTTSLQLLVESVDATHVWVDYNEPNDLTLPIGTSLVAITRPASIYSDPYAQLALNNSQVTVDSTGRAAFFLKDSRADALVTGTGFNTRIYPFLAGGYRAGNSSWLNAKDFPTIQAAVNAVPLEGGTVFIPAGFYDPLSTPAFNPPLTLPFDRSVCLRGEGSGATHLIYRNGETEPPFDPTLDLIHLTGNFQSIEDLSILGAGFALTPGHGSAIRIWRSGHIPGDDGVIFGSSVRRVAIYDALGYGIFVDNAPRGGIPQCAVWTAYEDVLVQNCQLGGVWIGARTTTQLFRNCNFRGMGGLSSPPNPAVRIEGAAGVAFRDSIFDDLGGTAISLQDTHNLLLDQCWFEGQLSPEQPCIDAGGTYSGLAVSSCIFISNQAYAPARNNLAALRIGGLGRNIRVQDMLVWLNTGDGALGTVPHIQVLPLGPGQPKSELVVIGGAARDQTGLSSPEHTSLRVDDGGCLGAMLGTAWRSRLVVLTTAERDTAVEWQAGDMIFNSSASKPQAYDGSIWHDLY